MINSILFSYFYNVILCHNYTKNDMLEIQQKSVGLYGQLPLMGMSWKNYFKNGVYNTTLIKNYSTVNIFLNNKKTVY